MGFLASGGSVYMLDLTSCDGAGPCNPVVLTRPDGTPYSDPSVPAITTYGFVWDLVYLPASRRLYVAAGLAGMRVFEFAGTWPNLAITEVGNWPPNDSWSVLSLATGTIGTDTYVFAGLNNRGIRVFRDQPGTVPPFVLVGSVNNPNPMLDLQYRVLGAPPTQKSLLFAAGSCSGGLLVFDVSVPSAPVFLTSDLPGGLAQGVSVYVTPPPGVGAYAYVAANSGAPKPADPLGDPVAAGKVWIYDVTNLAQTGTLGIPIASLDTCFGYATNVLVVGEGGANPSSTSRRGSRPSTGASSSRPPATPTPGSPATRSSDARAGRANG